MHPKAHGDPPPKDIYPPPNRVGHITEWDILEWVGHIRVGGVGWAHVVIMLHTGHTTAKVLPLISCYNANGWCLPCFSQTCSSILLYWSRSLHNHLIILYIQMYMYGCINIYSLIIYLSYGVNWHYCQSYKFVHVHTCTGTCMGTPCSPCPILLMLTRMNTVCNKVNKVQEFLLHI